MVIAKASLTENWSLLSGTGNVSVLDNNLILRINTTLPLNFLSLLIILYWSTFLLTFNTTILISLQSSSPGSKFLNKITGQLTLRQSKARDNLLWTSSGTTAIISHGCKGDWSRALQEIPQLNYTLWNMLQPTSRRFLEGITYNIYIIVSSHLSWTCRAGAEWPKVEQNYSGVEESWQQKWGNNLGLSLCTVPRSAVVCVVACFRRMELLSGVQERSGI